jgi:Domain of unknown function (DUF4157)
MLLDSWTRPPDQCSLHWKMRGVTRVKSCRGAVEVSPLSSRIRAFVEPRFEFDFSRVRLHTDLGAIALSRGLNAQAFTYSEDISYGKGGSPGIDPLTAHEPAHVVQQAGKRPLQSPAASAPAGHEAPPSVQRVLEVQRPGPHDASAFDRRDQLIDRLNAQSPAIHYFLAGQEIRATVIDAARLTEFDRRMQRFFDHAMLPMRLTSGADRVGVPGHFGSLVGDSFAEGNVDLDDLLADDDFSFRSGIVHFLTERASVPNYAKCVRINPTDSEFHRGNRLGKEAEAAVLQDFPHRSEHSLQLRGDPTQQRVVEQLRESRSPLSSISGGGAIAGRRDVCSDCGWKEGIHGGLQGSARRRRWRA